MNKRLVKFSIPIIILIILVGYFLSRSCEETKQVVNQPPKFSRIPAQIINEGDTFPNLDLTKYVTDPDDSLGNLSFEFSENHFLAVNLDNNILSARQPNDDWFGDDSIKVKVADKEGLSDFTQIHYIVQPVNDPPSLRKIPDQAIQEGGTFAPINLNNFVNDIDNSPDEIAWIVLSQTLVDVKISRNNIAYITPITADTFGKDTLLFIATDPDHLAATSRMYIEIDHVNDKLNIKLSSTHTAKSFALPNLNENKFGKDTVSILAQNQSRQKSISSITEKTFWERTPFMQIRNIAHQGVDDYLSLLFSPLQWDGNDVATFGLIVSASAATMTVDKNIQNKIISNKKYSNSDVLTFGEYYGRDITSVGASLAFGIYGLAANDRGMTTLGLEIIESYIIVNELTRLMKYSFGRARPYMNEGADHFYMFSWRDGEYQSLPSNHTALAFSLSTVIASHTDNYLLKSLIYSPAVLTAIERVYNDAHWTSDVLLGAAVGYFVSDYLTSRHKNKPDNNLSFGITPNGEINVVYKLD